MTNQHKLNEGKILVTGGAGFIGSAVVYELNKRGFTNIIITDYLGSDDKWKNLLGLEFEEFFPVQQMRKSIVEGGSIVADIQTIFHLGACSCTTERNMDFLADNNYRITMELALFACRRGIRFVYASSAATYGDGSQGFDDDESLLPRLRPLNAYGFSKHLFDLHAHKLGLLKHITGLKYFNVFGPNEEHKGEMRSVISKVYNEAKNNGVVKLFKSYHPNYADGESVRDFIYVKDAARMTVEICLRTDATGIFNIGTGKARSWNEVALAIFSALGTPPNIQYTEMPSALRDKYQYFTQAKMDKFLRFLPEAGARFTLESAVEDYIKNYLLPEKRLAE